MWHLIRRVVKRTPATARHHSPAVFAQQLVDEWSAQSTPASLPAPVQDALSSRALVRQLHLVRVLLQEDDEDTVLITEDELHRALLKGKASSPGDDGITYSVLRLMHKVPGNPLLRLYNMCLRDGCLPRAWTTSTIIPIPKPGTAKFRPISLTSCFSRCWNGSYSLVSCTGWKIASPHVSLASFPSAAPITASSTCIPASPVTVWWLFWTLRAPLI